MNLNRLRPTGVKQEDLDVWLSGVILDAIRDALEAGMPQREVYSLLRTITAQEHPLGSKEGFRVQQRDLWQDRMKRLRNYCARRVDEAQKAEDCAVHEGDFSAVAHAITQRRAFEDVVVVIDGPSPKKPSDD